AARRHSADVHVTRTGMGPERAARAARALATMTRPIEPAAMVGLCGALDDSLQPGDVVVADEVRFTDGTAAIALASAPMIAAELAAAGLPARIGPLVTTDRIVRGAARRELARTGAIAVDMESAPVVAELRRDSPERPVAVVRVVIDTPAQELM